MQDFTQALINFIAVAGGLFILWSFVGRMRELPAATRAGFAVIAGMVSAVATLVVAWIIGAATTGAPPA